MDDSANELLCFLVWPLQRQQWVFLSNCLVGVLPFLHFVTRSLCDHPPCAELGFSTPNNKQHDLLDNHHGDRRINKQKNGTLVETADRAARRQASDRLPTVAHRTCPGNLRIRLYTLCLFLSFVVPVPSLLGGWSRQYRRNTDAIPTQYRRISRGGMVVLAPQLAQHLAQPFFPFIPFVPFFAPLFPLLCPFCFPFGYPWGLLRIS